MMTKSPVYRDLPYLPYMAYIDALNDVVIYADGLIIYASLLIRADFNSSAIANITFRSQNTIYSICKRLYKKNFDQDVASSEWENLIRSIY